MFIISFALRSITNKKQRFEFVIIILNMIMSFNLVNASITFQIYINKILINLIDIIYVVYLNDILIYNVKSINH